MAKPTEPSRAPHRGFKLFSLIVVVLLIPMVMDQLDVDRESIRTAGRVVAVFTVLLLGYGLISKLLKLLGLVVAVLITLVVLVAEGKLEAPRLKDWFADRAAAGR